MSASWGFFHSWLVSGRCCARGRAQSARFMESLLWIFRIHWDPEPKTRKPLEVNRGVFRLMETPPVLFECLAPLNVLECGAVEAFGAVWPHMPFGAPTGLPPGNIGS